MPRRANEVSLNVEPVQRLEPRRVPKRSGGSEHVRRTK